MIGTGRCGLKMHASGTQAKISINISDVIFHHELEHAAITKSFLPPANEVWGKVIFSEACVKNSVHSGGVCLSACRDTTPQDQAGTPPPLAPGSPPRTRQVRRHPPGTRHVPTSPRTRQAPPGPGRHPPGPDIPRNQAFPSHPVEQSMLGDTVNERAVCILLECNLVYNI